VGSRDRCVFPPHSGTTAEPAAGGDAVHRIWSSAPVRLAGVRPEASTEGDPLTGPNLPSRSTRERISYNALVRLAGRTVGALITVVALHYATHYFGPTRWGVITAAVALSGLFVGVSDFGVTTITGREVASLHSDHGSVYGESLVAVLVVAVPVMALMAGADYAIYLTHGTIRELALVLLPLIPLNSLWLVGGAVLIARARNDLRATIDVATSLCLLGGVIAVVTARLDAVSYLWITVGMNAVGALMALVFARIYVRARATGGPVAGVRRIRKSAPLGWSMVLGSLNMQVDTILLSLVATAAVVGAFGLAYQLTIFGISIPPMLTVAILPKFMTADDHRRRRMLQTAFDVLTVVAVGVPLLAVVFAHGMVLLIGGHKFGQAVVPLVLLSLFVAAAFPARVFLDCLVYIHQERRLLALSALTTGINVIAAVVLVPITHAVGAAIAMLAGSGASLVLSWRTFHRIAGYSSSGWLSGKAIVVAGSLAGGYWLLHAFDGLAQPTGLVMVPEGLGLVIVYVAGVGAWTRTRHPAGFWR
jgi:O-antigen/teichoic acid export membrane protein